MEPSLAVADAGKKSCVLFDLCGTFHGRGRRGSNSQFCLAVTTRMCAGGKQDVSFEFAGEAFVAFRF
jgi:hypothetical protein